MGRIQAAIPARMAPEEQSFNHLSDSNKTLIKACRKFGCSRFDSVAGQRMWGLGFGKGMG